MRNGGRTLVCLATFASVAHGMCPYIGGNYDKLPKGHPPVFASQPTGEAASFVQQQPPEGFKEALMKIDFDGVRQDLKKLFKDSKDFWPADYGNYAPFFVRLAWHNSGSYRTSDGRGGADGGRQRFDPERSWDDNTNLDKARRLLWPIKSKYGVGLSWGDLIVLAGNTAIESMGGPILGFCAGRIDDPNGKASEPLGPSSIQEELFPCEVNGQCKSPLGSTTVGLIYLNPEGPMGKPDPALSSMDIVLLEGGLFLTPFDDDDDELFLKTKAQVRDSFGRMAMNDSETVALIGGGHAFGKTHGACPAGPGPSPKDDPFNPWPGKCDSGKGKDAFTSGFEGPWTPNPTAWDNGYFVNLLKYEWEVHKATIMIKITVIKKWPCLQIRGGGPGGKHQWRVANASQSPVAPGPQGDTQRIMALTSDISLIKDPTGKYPEIVRQFAASQADFDFAFAHAWYKLTTRDMGPVTRCIGKDVPPPQPFQYPLPDPLPPSKLANFKLVEKAVVELLGDAPSESPLTPLFLRLAWRCASTFRQTDYQGGCNGARIRFEPQSKWNTTKGIDAALRALVPVKDKFGNGLSWADLIVLAGNVAVEVGSRDRISLSFCGGRTDAKDGRGSQYLSPKVTGSFHDRLGELRDAIVLLGLTPREFTALSGAHSFGRMHANVSGFGEGMAWTREPSVLSNDYFQTLLQEEWRPYTVPKTGKVLYKAEGKQLFMLKTDLMLRADAELLQHVEEFAGDEGAFFETFAHAWTKLMNADRFEGPLGNVCNK
eukprot:jgi/Bigna1/87257/estExt_fgenesh1_pg.C_180110